MGDRILEPVKHGAFQVEKHKCHLAGLSEKSCPQSMTYIEHWNRKVSSFSRLDLLNRSVLYCVLYVPIRTSWFQAVPSGSNQILTRNTCN